MTGLSEQEQRLMAALRDLPEAAIDVKDVPEAPPENMSRACRPNLSKQPFVDIEQFVARPTNS